MLMIKKRLICETHFHAHPFCQQGEQALHLMLAGDVCYAVDRWCWPKPLSVDTWEGVSSICSTNGFWDICHITCRWALRTFSNETADPKLPCNSSSVGLKSQPSPSWEGTSWYFLMTHKARVISGDRTNLGQMCHLKFPFLLLFEWVLKMSY